MFLSVNPFQAFNSFVFQSFIPYHVCNSFVYQSVSQYQICNSIACQSVRSLFIYLFHFFEVILYVIALGMFRSDNYIFVFVLLDCRSNPLGIQQSLRYVTDAQLTGYGMVTSNLATQARIGSGSAFSGTDEQSYLQIDFGTTSHIVAYLH